MNEVISFAKEFGAWAAIAAVLIWQTIAREQRMVARMNEIEDYVRNELVEVLKKATNSIESSNKLINEMADALKRNLRGE